MLLLLALACSDGGPYAVTVDGYDYWIYVPEGLDEPADTLVHLHHSGDGQALAESAANQRDLEAAGLIGVFPMGGGEPGDDWRVGVNKDGIPRDDRAWLAAVARDLMDRGDVAALWMSGYSKGGAMAYDYACLGEPLYEGYLPMSGAFQDQVPEDCPNEARPIRHLQGAEDDKWPLTTAADPESSHEGILDSLEGLAVTAGDCMATSVEEGDCQVWPECGADVRLCWFDGGHEKPDGWILDHRDWIDAH